MRRDTALLSTHTHDPLCLAACPLLLQGQCVGLAFQSLTGDTQSVGYVIPTSVVSFADESGQPGSSCMRTVAHRCPAPTSDPEPHFIVHGPYH